MTLISNVCKLIRILFCCYLAFIIIKSLSSLCKICCVIYFLAQRMKNLHNCLNRQVKDYFVPLTIFIDICKSYNFQFLYIRIVHNFKFVTVKVIKVRFNLTLILTIVGIKNQCLNLIGRFVLVL